MLVGANLANMFTVAVALACSVMVCEANGFALKGCVKPLCLFAFAFAFFAFAFAF